MTNARPYSYIIAALAVALLPALPESPAQPAPKEKPSLPLVRAGEVKLTGFWQEDAAVIDESTVVLVGTKRDGGDDPPEPPAPPDAGDAAGAIVDLAGKTSRPFTNGHKARIHGVSASRGRVATVSNHRDPVLRVWDVRAGRTVAEAEIEHPLDRQPSYGVAWLHKSDRVAVAADEQVFVFDPADPVRRIVLAIPVGTSGWLQKPAISPDDTRVACTAGLKRAGVWDKAVLVFWDVATKRATAISLTPERADNPDEWHTGGVTFGPKGELIAWRDGGAEVPEEKAEADVPANRRSIVRIDLPAGRLVPLGMGHTGGSFHCAIDPSGTWLASAGISRRNKPRPDGASSVGELRVYHLPSGSLALREQFDSVGSPTWVAFTPSGKRVVTATCCGTVRWWDVQGK